MRKTRTLAIAITILIGMFGGWFLATQTADADDAKGCEGLADYRAEMFELWRGDGDGGSLLDGRDPLTLSSDEWIEVADAAVDYQRELREIEVPDFAKPWHQAQIELIGLAEQMSRAIAKEGFFAAFVFLDSIEVAEKKSDETVNIADATCPDFTDFVHDFDALDGDIDGTPVATPTD